MRRSFIIADKSCNVLHNRKKLWVLVHQGQNVINHGEQLLPSFFRRGKRTRPWRYQSLRLLEQRMLWCWTWCATVSVGGSRGDADAVEWRVHHGCLLLFDCSEWGESLVSPGVGIVRFWFGFEELMKANITPVNSGRSSRFPTSRSSLQYISTNRHTGTVPPATIRTPVVSFLWKLG